jgi:DNA repair and recombination protein RAD52
VEEVKPDIFSGEQQKLLADNLNPKHVKGRSQGGQSLSYIEGWHAIAEANRIFGFGAWERELVEWKETNRDLVDVTKNNRTEKQWRVGYIAKVRVTVHGEGGSRSREGVGFGSGFAKDNALGEAIESAIKEAETDAMKRGMMTFGNQFGLALYDKSRSMVGPSQIANDDEDGEQVEEEAPAPPPIPEHKRRANTIIADIEGGKSVADVESVMKRAVRTLATLKDNYPKEYERVQEARTLALGRLSVGTMQAAE